MKAVFILLWKMLRTLSQIRTPTVNNKEMHHVGMLFFKACVIVHTFVLTYPVSF